jgi:hypothetical protein
MGRRLQTRRGVVALFFQIGTATGYGANPGCDFRLRANRVKISRRRHARLVRGADSGKRGIKKNSISFFATTYSSIKHGGRRIC